MQRQTYKPNSLDKLGFIVAAIATVCLMGFERLINLMKSMGLGMLLERPVLISLLVAGLLVGMVGMTLSFKHHRQPVPLILHVAGSLLLVYFIMVAPSVPLAWLGLVVLSVAAFWNSIKDRPESAPPQEG